MKRRLETITWRHAAMGLLALSGMGAAAQAQTTAGSAISTDSATVLPSLLVQGDADGFGAASGTNGYVATKSSAGTKSDTSLLETPQAISVITRDQMTEQNAQSLNDALRYTAGVTPETRGSIGSRYDMFKVRGFDADTYWNGLKLQGNGYYILPQVDPYFMDRIDVVKGTSSALYGQANAGGVVDQQGKMPTDTPQHEIGIEGGTFSHLRGTIDMSGPVTDNNRLLYRIVGIGLTEDGQQKYTQNQRVGVMPSFTVRPGEDTSINLYALYQFDPAAGPYGTIPVSGSVLPARKGSIAANFFDGDPGYDRFVRTQTAIGYQMESQLAQPLKLQMNGRWFHTEQKYQSIYGTGAVDSDGTLTRNVYASNDNADSFAMDNRLQGKFATGPVHHTVVGGADFQTMKTSYWTGGVYSSVPSINVYAPQYYVSGIPAADLSKTSMASDQVGTYLQDQVELAGFTLTLSGRQDWAESKTLTTGAKQFDKAFTGRTGLSYLFENGVSPYVSFSQSFVPQSGIDAVTGKALDPERGEQYEAGVKYQPTGMNALFTADVFQLTRSNLSTYVSGLGYVQSGRARSKGVEFEGKTEIVKNLNLLASYTYLDTRYLQDDTGLTGKRLAGIPHNTASAWADYRISSGPLDGLDIGSGVRFFDESTNTANTFLVNGTTLFDATLRYDLGKLNPLLAGADIYVNGKNLFDQKYVASCYYGDSTGSSNWCAYGYQRTVVAGLHYRW
ncbi:TonB-dependent siderophore receptor [Telmatospirillum siberiense]|nr:TonB-dependent siderophore receptor [Telmatospirillum siberiense]